jgi:hypothetical protein
MQFPCCRYPTETRRLIGVLQHWQVLLAPSADAVTEVTLADVQAVTAALLHTFGPTTTLETLIQHLVAQDLREQIEQREQRQAGPHATSVAA